MWPEAISPFAGSNEPTAKPVSRKNTSASPRSAGGRISRADIHDPPRPPFSIRRNRLTSAASAAESDLMQTYSRGPLSVTLIAVVFTALFGHSALSETPTTFKIVVPYPPASGPDILSRLMAEQIGRAQGPSVVVENRPGGGTLIGTEAVARAAPDGGTVLLVANSFVVNPALKKLSYDPVTSFEPVCYLAATPIVLVVNGTSPYRSLADLITAARAKPG